MKKYILPILNALEFFIENPNEEIHLREFARRAEISVNSAQRFLKIFLENNFIQDFRKVNLRYFKANLDSIVFRNIKLIFSLKKIEKSGLLEFLKKDFIYVVLFGSVAKGLDDKTSDLDLVCIGKFKKQLDLHSFEKKIGKEINVQIFDLEKWRNCKTKNKAFYQDVISTGINLVGEMPV